MTRMVPFPPLSGAVVAIILWLLSSFLPTGPLLLVLLLSGTFLVQPLFGREERRPDGTIRREWWTLGDWIGVAILIVVFYALWTGIDPLKILALLTKAGGA